MQYRVISADCHIDLIWLPPDLFTTQASAALKERMPYVTDGPKGKQWVAKNGAYFGLMNGMGSAGREYIPGQIHRSDRMASTGLYDDGKKGIRRLSDPALRIKDQDRDGVQAEVLYGVLGASMRINDDEAATEILRIYNEWLAGFCRTHPDRFGGLACIPSHDMAAAVTEIRRVAKRGGVRGLDIANRRGMTALWDPWWNPMWDAAAETGLPVHFHTVGGTLPDYTKMPPKVGRAAHATFISSFQLHMAELLMAVIFSGVLERHPTLKLVIGESGTGWIPYVLDHMDLEWEDQYKDLDLTMKPSEYWRRQCYATYQTDRIGVKLIDELGEDNVMWGSDFPHPDGIWPDSQEYIEKELGHLPERVRRKIVRDNAAKLYGFAVN
jgi:predicted TIM-barrel fold metal-dependent hydrolase